MDNKDSKEIKNPLMEESEINQARAEDIALDIQKVVNAEENGEIEVEKAMDIVAEEMKEEVLSNTASEPETPEPEFKPVVPETVVSEIDKEDKPKIIGAESEESDPEEKKADGKKKLDKAKLLKIAGISALGLTVLITASGFGFKAFKEAKIYEEVSKLASANLLIDIDFHNVSADFFGNGFTLSDVTVALPYNAQSSASNMDDAIVESFKSFADTDRNILLKAKKLYIDGVSMTDGSIEEELSVQVKEGLINLSILGEHTLIQAASSIPKSGFSKIDIDYKQTVEPGNVWKPVLVTDIQDVASFQIEGSFITPYLMVLSGRDINFGVLKKDFLDKVIFDTIMLVYKDHGLIDAYIGNKAVQLEMSKEDLYGKINKINALYKRDMEKMGSDIGASMSEGINDMVNKRADIFSMVVDKGSNNLLTNFTYKFNDGSLFEKPESGYRVKFLTN
jgi:hypothetical protein